MGLFLIWQEWFITSRKKKFTPLKISLPENETTVNLKNASLVIIMHLHEGLTHIQSQIKPWLLFSKSFTLERVTGKSLADMIVKFVSAPVQNT